MTKAERIFNDTYRECRNHIKKYGYEDNSGFNSMFYRDNEVFYRRTASAVQKIIDGERKQLDIDRKIGALSEERIKFLENALNMVQVTLNNTTTI